MNTGPLLVPHSIKKTQTGTEGSLVVPHPISSLHREMPQGLTHGLAPTCCLSRVALCPVPIPVPGWRMASRRGVAAAGLAAGRSAGGGWGSGEVWPPPRACRCRFPRYWLQHVTDTQRCCTAGHRFRNGRNSPETCLKLVPLQKNLCCRMAQVSACTERTLKPSC